MFDFGQKWTPSVFALAGALGADLYVRTLTGLHLTLVSGDTIAGLARLGIKTAPHGATSIAPAYPFALGLARDRCLAVSWEALTSADGWHSEGFAVTTVSDAYVGLEFTGRDLSLLLAQATTLDWASPTRSAAIEFAGISAVSAFTGDRKRLMLLVEPSQISFLSLWLESSHKYLS